MAPTVGLQLLATTANEHDTAIFMVCRTVASHDHLRHQTYFATSDLRGLFIHQDVSGIEAEQSTLLSKRHELDIKPRCL